MALTPRQVNSFTFLKLPAAWWTGVRVKSLSSTQCITTVKHRWFNQNPFKSMFWAVQGMAAELSTGALVMDAIRESGKPVSMLVANNKATFSKKATGRITFQCYDGLDIKRAIMKAVDTGDGQTCWMRSRGVNTEGVEVSVFEFEWTVKLKNRG